MKLVTDVERRRRKRTTTIAADVIALTSDGHF